MAAWVIALIVILCVLSCCCCGFCLLGSLYLCSQDRPTHRPAVAAAQPQVTNYYMQAPPQPQPQQQQPIGLVNLAYDPQQQPQTLNLLVPGPAAYQPPAQQAPLPPQLSRQASHVAWQPS